MSERFDNQTRGVQEGSLAVERKITTVVCDNVNEIHTGYVIQDGKARLAFTDANWSILRRLMIELEST